MGLMFVAPKWYDKEKVFFVGTDCYFQTGQQVFVRKVDDTGIVIQDPWDSHIRCLVQETDLEVRLPNG